MTAPTHGDVMCEEHTIVNDQPRLLAAFADATEADLAQVQSKLAALQNEVACLKEIEKILQKRFPHKEKTASNKAARIDAAVQESGKHGQTKKDGTVALLDVVSVLKNSCRKGQWMLITEAARELCKTPNSVIGVVKHHPDVLERGGDRLRIRDESLTKDEDDDSWREIIHDYLSTAGVTKPAVIAHKLTLSAEQVTKLVAEHKWFQKTPDGYAVA